MDIASLNHSLQDSTTKEILHWAWQSFGPKVMASSSFQTQSVPLLHLISQVCPSMPIIFLDTGFHFSETLSFRDELQKLLNLTIKVLRPAVDQSQLLTQYGEGLYRRDPDLCCYINKVEPLQRVSSTLQALVTGVRRDQTANRHKLRVIESGPTGELRVHPMLHWTNNDIRAYMDEKRLPSHPLLAKGYLSVGCAPCTRPVNDDEHERAGRWAAQDKTECGLHLNLQSMGEKV